MFEAILHGKLPSELVNLEDFLTSNVFATFRSLGSPAELLRFLGNASLPNKPDTKLAERMRDVAKVDYLFWLPMEEEGCAFAEPDVLLMLHHGDGTDSAVLVEAKLYSGKSSGPGHGDRPVDQLAREYDNLLRWAYREHRIPPERCYLVYCTAGIRCPTKSIADSRDEFLNIRRRPMVAYWLTWRLLPRLLAESERPVLRELACVLTRMGLVFFEGIDLPPQEILSGVDCWVLKDVGDRFAWSFAGELPEWHYVG